MITKSHVRGCHDCRICEGAAYQLPPFLYAGRENADVLVIAQNPGEIDAKSWQLGLTSYAFSLDNADSIRTFYEVDFMSSHGYQKLGQIFGEEWLETGKFLYTNAVRCRTQGNAAPSDEMVRNCSGWTGMFTFPKVVVLMGRVAVKQVSTILGKSELPAWSKVRLKQSSRVSTIITIPHYAAMRSHEDINKARELFMQAADEAGVVI